MVAPKAEAIQAGAPMEAAIRVVAPWEGEARVGGLRAEAVHQAEADQREAAVHPWVEVRKGAAVRPCQGAGQAGAAAQPLAAGPGAVAVPSLEAGPGVGAVYLPCRRQGGRRQRYCQQRAADRAQGVVWLLAACKMYAFVAHQGLATAFWSSLVLKRKHLCAGLPLHLREPTTWPAPHHPAHLSPVSV